MPERRPPAPEPAHSEAPAAVSVVIPTYRRPQRLIACLDGLARQNRPPDQIVCVVRDEDAETQEAVQEWKRRNPQLAQCLTVAVVSQPGQIPAMNAGLAAAKGDVVAFTDDDCVPRPEWISRMLAHYADRSVGGVGGRDVIHYGDRIVEGDVRVVGRYQWFGRPIGNHHLSLIGCRPADVDILKGANMSFRKKLMRPFDEALQMGSAQCNDLDMSLHVRRQGYRLVYDPAVVVDHFPAQRFGESTRDTEAPHMLYAEGHNWMYVALKHAAWWQVPVVLLYGFLIGHARAYGLGRAAWSVFRDGPRLALHRLYHSLRGKLGGIMTWLQSGRG
ncbi:MAG: glycosyltransferase [Armatimonadetes bacterium]|nr:glycosyltransferase [Armatimonadota bacterium]